MRLRLWLDLASRLFVAAAALVLLSFILDWWLELSRMARVTYVVLSGILLAWSAARMARAIVRMRLEPIELAHELDKARRSSPAQWLAPRVATVLTLADARTREPSFSGPMVERAVRHSWVALEGIDFSRRLDERQLRRCLILLAAAAAAPLLFAATIPNEFSSVWARRWILGSNVPWPRDTALDVLGLSEGRLVVPRGEPATIRVTVRDRRADRAGLGASHSSRCRSGDVEPG